VTQVLAEVCHLAPSAQYGKFSKHIRHTEVQNTIPWLRVVLRNADAKAAMTKSATAAGLAASAAKLQLQLTVVHPR